MIFCGIMSDLSRNTKALTGDDITDLLMDLTEDDIIELLTDTSVLGICLRCPQHPINDMC